MKNYNKISDLHWGEITEFRAQSYAFDKAAEIQLNYPEAITHIKKGVHKENYEGMQFEDYYYNVVVEFKTEGDEAEFILRESLDAYEELL